jgi:hypothetical protein
MQGENAQRLPRMVSMVFIFNPPFQIPLDSTGSFSTLIFFFRPPLAP